MLVTEAVDASCHVQVEVTTKFLYETLFYFCCVMQASCNICLKFHVR